MELLIALAVAGLLLIGAEMFVPGLVLGALGGLCLAGSALVCFQEYGPAAGGIYSIALLALAFVAFLVWMKWFPKTGIGRKIILHSPAAVIRAPLDELMGKSGEALTPLRPSGTARIDGRKMDVTTEGAFIEAGSGVEVVLVEGNRVVVRKRL